MIIFDLDGTLANCEHRRHFVDPEKNENFFRYNGNDFRGWKDGQPQLHIKFKPDWKSFYEACDKDEPIEPVLSTFIHLTQGEPFNHDVQIWSGRCESVREKTLKWLVNLTGYCEDYQYWDRRLKMRPIGDNTPDDQLKERWLDEYIQVMKPFLMEYDTKKNITMRNPIEMVFDDRPKVIRMWRRRGIFVFNCCQNDEEF